MFGGDEEAVGVARAKGEKEGAVNEGDERKSVIEAGVEGIGEGFGKGTDKEDGAVGARGKGSETRQKGARESVTGEVGGIEDDEAGAGALDDSFQGG